MFILILAQMAELRDGWWRFFAFCVFTDVVISNSAVNLARIIIL